jgi:Skp family chaperone for outer membrane proteins
MEIDIIEVKEQLRDVRRFAERKQEELQEQINMQKAAMNLLELFDRVLHENERLKGELEQQQTENDDLHQQLENLRQQLSSDFMNQQAALTQQLQDSVQACLRDMNADGHYHLILNDAVLLNKTAGYDITDEVIEALNARYTK